MASYTGPSSSSHGRSMAPLRPSSVTPTYHTADLYNGSGDSEHEDYGPSYALGSSSDFDDASQVGSDEESQFHDILKALSADSINASSADPTTHFTAPIADRQDQLLPPAPLPLQGDIPCLHPIHPAYADTYLFAQCPACQLSKLVVLARIPALTIITHGGRELWKQTFTLSKSGDAYKAENHRFLTTVGQHKKRTNKGKDWHVDEYGNVSFSRAKTSVLNYIQRLEWLAEVEQAWEERNPVDKRDQETTKRCDAAWAYTAVSALAQWHGSTKSGFQKVEEMSRKWARKRGRELEIASRPEFPESEDVYTKSRVLLLTQEQREFVNANLSPEIDISVEEGDEGPPKRKRRRLSATVDFDTHTYVRSEADVDLLFAPSSSVATNFLQDAHTHTTVPLRSVLRTAPLHMYPSPGRPHEVKALDTRDRYTAHGVRKHRGRSKEGYDRVDTSGYKKKGKLWNDYRMAFAVEAGQQIDVEGEDRRAIEDEEDISVEGVAAASQTAGGQAVQESGLQVDTIGENDVPTDAEVAEVKKQIEEAQRAQKAQQTLNKLPEARFRPHGGMASAFAFGTFVGGAAVELAHRAGLW